MELFPQLLTPFTGIGHPTIPENIDGSPMRQRSITDYNKTAFSLYFGGLIW
jgi:hypothetical protein